MLKLRDYQQECVDVTLEHIKTYRKALVQLPTGAGKTVVFWSIITQGFSNALIVVPSMQLAEQCWQQGLNFVESSFISRKYGRINQKPSKYHIVTVQSLSDPEYLKTIIKQNYEVLIVDEAHRAGSRSYQALINTLLPTYLLGLTATPTRSDTVQLSEIFGNLVFQKSITDLIRQKHLCNMHGYRIKTDIDIKGVNSPHGEFNISKLYKCLNTDDRNNLIVKTYLENCQDLKTLVFAINVSHCLILEKMLCDKGITARAVYGTMTFEERSKILKSFKEGSIKCLINNQLLTEGFDEPSIECLLIARPTQSRILYHQMIGRGLRPHPGKKYCKLVELADNYHRLCNFWSLHVEDELLNLSDTPYKAGMDLLSLEKEWLEINDLVLSKEELSLFDDPLDDLRFDFLDKDVEPLAPACVCEDMTILECLFLKWKIRKLKEFKQWQQS